MTSFDHFTSVRYAGIPENIELDQRASSLFVLDGIQVGNYSKISSMLDPTMIKSIRILKNAVDLSMYGFAGSGGVIEIKTK